MLSFFSGYLSNIKLLLMLPWFEKGRDVWCNTDALFIDLIKLRSK